MHGCSIVKSGLFYPDANIRSRVIILPFIYGLVFIWFVYQHDYVSGDPSITTGK